MSEINSKNATSYTAEEAKNEILRLISEFAVGFYTNYKANQGENPFNKNLAIKEIKKFITNYKEKLVGDYIFIRNIFEKFLDGLMSKESRYEAYYSEHSTKLYNEILEILEIDNTKIEYLTIKVKHKINNILNSLKQGKEVSNEELVEYIKQILISDGWEIQQSANPESKGIKIKHDEYGTFASGMVDENREYIIDETGIPANFTLLLKGGGNLVRMNGGQIRYTGSFKK